jgi:hypothetical protein
LTKKRALALFHMDREPATFLPESIRDALKRKSSRDPTSRFHTKLHLLLSYSIDSPTFQDQIGLAWVTDDEFKMNKSVLSEVMGIKLNTLNVNLRDLHFQQLQRDKEGWTRWKRAGFTRAANTVDNEGETTLPSPLRRPAHATEPGFVGRNPSLAFTLGHLTDLQNARFLSDSHRLWNAILQCSPTVAVSADVAIDRAADRFRYEEQPLQNAKDVIDAIIRPSTADSRLVFTDFCRFLAMFGPESTIMLKIASLLTCSNGTGNWLTFDRGHSASRTPFAYFDPAVPNCLVVHHGDNMMEKVYNNPTAESGREPYVIDEFGKVYKDWDEWFGKHPVRQPLTFGAFSFPGDLVR